MRFSERWSRHLFYRKGRLTFTWKLRLGLPTVVGLVLWSSANWWGAVLAADLVCEERSSASDAILIENFDPNYLTFERAADLRRAGLASRVVVPLPARAEHSVNSVSLGVAEVMARIARLGSFEPVAVRQVEPISLNAAHDVARYLRQERIRSVTVVTPLFRSRRSALVYGRVFGLDGIDVHCQAVRGTQGIDNWMETWHGMQAVAEQWLKLQYYRFYVLRFAEDGE
jgi:hypothetical protein